MSSARFLLCILLASVALSTVSANAMLRQKRDDGMYKQILLAVGGPVDSVLGTVGGVYGQFPALVWLEAILQGISISDILKANGGTVDSIVSPVLGTVIKPKGTGATGVPAATTVPSA